MGGVPCLIIIQDGDKAYSIVEKFKDKHPAINTYKLEAAINASCDSISFAGIYYFLKEEKSIENSYTKPIIDLHARIINELPQADNDAQNLVNSLAKQLWEATYKLRELFNE